MNEDALVEVPLEKWRELREVFGKRWTAAVPYYYALHLNINYPGVREAFKFKVYCPYGDVTNGLVAFSEKNTVDILMMPVSDDTQKLENAMAETKLIDWSRRTCMDLLCPVAAGILHRLQQRINLTEFDIMPVTTFFYDRDMASFSEMSLPENTYAAPVKLKDVARVDDAWPYKHSSSHHYFSTLVSNGLSYGLYSATDHGLVAWVFLNEYSFITHLYCEEAYRKLGCGVYLLKQLVNGQLRNGEAAYGFVVEGNVRSANLFKKLGFKTIEQFSWGYVKK